MKYIFFLLPLFLFGQSDEKEFKLTKYGYTEPIVFELEKEVSAENMYKEAKRWIQLNYVNPDAVEKGEFENDFIRFSGFSRRAVQIGNGILKSFQDISYTIMLEFKTGKFRMTIIEFDVSQENREHAFADINKGKNCFKKDGTLKKAANCSKGIPQVDYFFNSFAQELKDVLSGEVREANDDW